MPAPDSAETRYPPVISDYIRNLAQQVGDPIGRQIFPDPREVDNDPFGDDGLGEIPQSAVPRLIHRYPHHALLLATDRCAVRCRFCFRKRLWRNPLGDITDAELTAAADYLKRTPSVREVLISGGDPLMLPTSILSALFETLAAISSIRLLRLGTRLPAMDPSAVTDAHIALLGRYNVRLMLHFNHVAELTPQCTAVLAKLRKAGLLLYAQTVLLQGVNDNPDALEALFLSLAEHGVHPHYLFHVDPVTGVSHFAVGLKRSHAMVAELHKRLSSLLLPQFAIDLPDGKGKILISPDTPLPDPPIFVSPLTGEPVLYPFK